MGRRIALLCLLVGCGHEGRPLQRSTATSTVTGALCNEATNRFVSGAELTLLEHDTDGTLLTQRVGTTDATGRFTFEKVGNGRHQIVGAKGDFHWSTDIQVTAGKDLSLPVPDCQLPSGVVIGRICDGAHGDWLVGATVSIVTAQGTRVSEAPTNTFGEFRVADVPAGQQEVVAEKDGVRLVLPVTVMGDSETDLGVTECVQDGLSNVQGQICANAPGIWLAGATVTTTIGATAYTATTDSEGRFRLRGLPAGSHKVSVKKGVYTTSFEARTEVNQTAQLSKPICTPPDLPVAVVSGEFDRVQRVMSQLQFQNLTIYQGYPEHDATKDLQADRTGSWSAQLLDGAQPEIFTYKMAMFNGGLSLADLGSENSEQRVRRLTTLRQFVQGGGVVYVSDWAFVLLTGVFGAPLAFADALAPIQQVNANVVDPLLATKLASDSISINFPRDDWRLVSNMTADVKTYLRSSVTTSAGVRPDVPLIVSFPYGEGRGVYTSIPSDRQPSMRFNSVIDHIIFDL